MKTITNKAGNTDLRAMLIGAGVGDMNASMAIQFMNFLPTTTDPYAAGTIEVVKGLQRLLMKRGARIEADGGLGQRTVEALIPYAGPRWYDKSWSQLYGDVMDGRLWQSWDRESRAEQKNALSYYNTKMKTSVARGMDPSAASLGATRFATTAVAGLGHTAYHHVGLGADLEEALAYCTVAHPYPGCTAIAGVAKPMTASTLEVFQAIQRALNALLAKRNGALIDVDGRIGPQTLAAMKFYLADGVKKDTIDAIAQNAHAILAQLTTLMLATGAGLVADPAPKSPPSVAGVNGAVINPSDSAIAASMGGGLDKLLPIAAVVVGGLLVMKMTSKRGRARARR